MGFYILYQFLFKRTHEHHTHVGDLSSFKVIPQGAIAGFLDAIGGGGWGPVNTPLLLSSKKIQPRYARLVRFQLVNSLLHLLQQ